MRRDRSAVWVLTYTVQDSDESYWWSMSKELNFPTQIEAKAFLVAEHMRGAVILKHDLRYVSRKLKSPRRGPKGEGIKSVRQARQERRFK